MEDEIDNRDDVEVQKSDSDDHVSRKRSRSPSSQSDSSDEDLDARKTKKKRVSDIKFEFLSQQVAFLTNLISQKQFEPQTSNAPRVVESAKAPSSRSTDDDLGLRPPPSASEADEQQLKLSDLSTTLKDPPIPRSNDRHLEKISHLQRFNCNDWYAIRFSEAQKKYVTSPGFVELCVNDELRRFNTSGSNEDRTYLLERTYAALTSALLTQKDELRTALQGLVDWSNDKDTTLSPKTLFDKIEQTFSKDSNYTKVTDDILQMSCGRRADCINSRREAILKKIPEEYHYGALQKIPPSAESLFNSDMLASYLQKIGGADKLTACFQPAPYAAAASTSGARRAYDAKPKPSTSKQANDQFRGNYNKDKAKGNRKGSNNYKKPNDGKTKQQYSKGKRPHSNSQNRNNSL